MNQVNEPQNSGHRLLNLEKEICVDLLTVVNDKKYGQFKIMVTLLETYFLVHDLSNSSHLFTFLVLLPFWVLLPTRILAPHLDSSSLYGFLILSFQSWN